jgi:hypothetical protein
MLEKMKKTNKSVIVIAILTIAVLSFSTVLFLGETQAGQISVARPVNEMMYSTSLDERFIDDARHVTIQKGNTIRIPISVSAAMDRSLDVKAGVTSDGYEGILTITGEAILPEGVSATLDKTSFVHEPTTELGISKRDSANLTIQVDKNAKSGDYPLTLVLYEQNGDTISQVREYFTLHVE